MNSQHTYMPMILVATAIAMAALALSLFCIIRRTTDPRSVTLPAQDEIAMMTATIDDSRESLGIDPLPTFVISPEYYAIILSALTPTEEYEYPASFENMTVGRVEILKKGDKRLTIKFCEAGNNLLHFSIDGIRCRRGGEYKPTFVSKEGQLYDDESMIFYNILRAIHEEQITRNKSDELTHAVQRLRRSIGQEPPEER